MEDRLKLNCQLVVFKSEEELHNIQTFSTFPLTSLSKQKT